MFACATCMPVWIATYRGATVEVSADTTMLAGEAAAELLRSQYNIHVDPLTIDLQSKPIASTDERFIPTVFLANTLHIIDGRTTIKPWTYTVSYIDDVLILTHGANTIKTDWSGANTTIQVNSEPEIIVNAEMTNDTLAAQLDRKIKVSEGDLHSFFNKHWDETITEQAWKLEPGQKSTSAGLEYFYMADTNVMVTVDDLHSGIWIDTVKRIELLFPGYNLPSMCIYRRHV